MTFGKKTDKTEVTLKSQIKKVFFAHIKGIAIIFVVFFFFYLSLWMIKFVDKIMGALMLIIYAIVLASSANACAIQDKRTYTVTKPYPAKGLLLAVSIIASNLFFAVLWQAALMSESIVVQVTGKIVFFLWSLPYNSFLDLNAGSLNALECVLMAAVPLVSVVAGYLAGYYNWDIYEKLDKIAFEKK